ncbi:transporter associated domain-containing protein, partial [Streptomyces microflavus]|uniref:hemolysin family protein n=1 Tax=Streptomyces microflavus TaxID=1919 RepID=UPI0033CCF0BE
NRPSVNWRGVEVLNLTRATGLSRFPVYRDRIDEVVGMVHLKNALAVPAQDRLRVPLSRIAVPPLLVPETLPVEQLLQRLRSEQPIAVVVDEYGGTDGVVTVEDLVEELVGEIADEFDPATVDDAHDTGLTVPGGERTVLVDGVLREDELYEQTGFRLPEGPYETLAGFLMARLGHIPLPGETTGADGYEFTVVEVERHRIEQVRVVRPEEPHVDD